MHSKKEREREEQCENELDPKVLATSLKNFSLIVLEDCIENKQAPLPLPSLGIIIIITIIIMIITIIIIVKLARGFWCPVVVQNIGTHLRSYDEGRLSRRGNS